MRLTLSTLSAALLLVVLVIVPSAAFGSSNPFVGAWESFDDLPGDTSHVRMQLSSTGQMTLRDEAATGCARQGFGLVPATFHGAGQYDLTADPQSFTAHGDLYCHTDQGRVLVYSNITTGFEYDPVGDALIGTNVHRPCWTRTGVGDQALCP